MQARDETRMYPVTGYLTREEVDELRAFAAIYERSVSYWVREAIRKLLHAEEE